MPVCGKDDLNKVKSVNPGWRREGLLTSPPPPRLLAEELLAVDKFWGSHFECVCVGTLVSLLTHT